MKEAPIGIFDSGVGGLTVANQVAKLLPHKSIVYFGDIAHLPYGDKSKEAILSYSIKICDFLIEKGCETIVIACNTASAFAYKELKKRYPNYKLHNVIDPVVNYVSANYSNTKIGVIGTKGTISSRVYPKLIRNSNKRIEVRSIATPLLVPLIEEGLFNTFISKAIIEKYLSNKSFEGISSLILGCTHYPLIKDEINEFYDGNVEVINSAEIVAREVCDGFSLEGSSKKQSTREFYVSDYTKAFEKSAKNFFGAFIKLNRIEL